MTAFPRFLAIRAWNALNRLNFSLKWQTSVEPFGLAVQYAGTAKELVAFVIDSLL